MVDDISDIARFYNSNLELDDGRRLPLFIRNTGGDIETDGWLEE